MKVYGICLLCLIVNYMKIISFGWKDAAEKTDGLWQVMDVGWNLWNNCGLRSGILKKSNPSCTITVCRLCRVNIINQQQLVALSLSHLSFLLYSFISPSPCCSSVSRWMRPTQISHYGAQLGNRGWVLGYLNNVMACREIEGADKQTNNQISATRLSLSPYPLWRKLFLGLKIPISLPKILSSPSRKDVVIH